ncbi:MAG TPA: PIN domain-containing protein [Streptosporangiaceae bacterium]|nr:PIN domain-containing protein [Streptosporangiaceae bacterium]
MAFIVVYDANVLVGNTQRDLLVRLAQTGLIQAKWTDRILDEALAAVQKSRPDIPADRLGRVRELMIEAVPDCLVRGHEPLIEGLHLRDTDDRHVLAAAIKAGAQVIVTADKDFTASDLAHWGIEPKHPDDFVLDQIDINDRIVWGCVQQISISRKRRPETVEDVLSQLERSGLVQSAAALRRNWSSTA